MAGIDDASDLSIQGPRQPVVELAMTDVSAHHSDISVSPQNSSPEASKVEMAATGTTDSFDSETSPSCKDNQVAVTSQPFEPPGLLDIPDEILALDDQHQQSAPPHRTGTAAMVEQMEVGTSRADLAGAAMNSPLPSMLNSNAIQLEEDASGDLSTSSNEALTPTSTVSRGNYHQCGSARRVKVYELKGETWHDRGTGYCAGVYDETVDEALLVARREENCQFLEGVDAATDPDVDINVPDGSDTEPDETKKSVAEMPTTANQAQPCQFVVVVSEDLESNDILLASKVVKEEVYQRQQDTLVVWTEPSGMDMALSFQEAEGCNEVWEFLTEVQKHFMGLAEEALTDSPPTTPNPHSPSGELGMSASGSMTEPLLDSFGFFVGLPDPSLATLEKIDLMLKEATSRGPMVREKLTTWLTDTHYIRRLVPFFHTIEELEALPALHMLCTIMQTILLLNDTFMFELILQDDVFLGVVGMLEYDPEFPRLKANYREHLSQKAKFKQVIEIGLPMIETKIHQTYRLLYLRDVILARVVDDSTVSILNSFIFFHQNDIVNHYCHDEFFLGRLFWMFSNPNESDEKRSEGILFLQQLCAMAKLIQLPARISLYRTLTRYGLLNVLQLALERLGSTARNAAAEVLMTIIEYDANSVRVHTLSQVEENTRPLVSMMIDMLHNETDQGLKAQIAEAMRIIFDVASDGGPMATQAQMLSVQGLTKAKPDADRFLTWIYEAEITRLCAPFNSLPDFRVLSKGEKLPVWPRHRSALYGHLCDLLCHMIAHHSFRSQYFVLTSDISKKVGALLHSREKYMRLCALRFFRYCLASNNQFTNRHFIKIELFSTILDLTEAEGEKNNLVASACLDFFEHMRRENMWALLDHCMDKHSARMRRLAELPQLSACFHALISQWENNQEPSLQDGKETSSKEEKEVSAEERLRLYLEVGQPRRQLHMGDRRFYELDAVETSNADESSVDASPSGRGLVPYDDDDEDESAKDVSTSEASGDASVDADSALPAAEESRSRLPEKRRRDEAEADDDPIDRIAKRKSGRFTKTKPRTAAATEKEEAEGAEQSPPGGFIRSVANTISNTFGGGGSHGNGSSPSKHSSSSSSSGKLGQSQARSPSPKGSKSRAAGSASGKEEETSPHSSPSSRSNTSSKPSGVVGTGIKKISLGLSASSRKAAAQTSNSSTRSPNKDGKETDQSHDS